MKRADISQRGIRTFLWAGIFLALIRIASYLYLNHRQVTHTLNENVSALKWVLYPELSIVSETGIAQTENMNLFITINCLVLILGSLLWTTPIIFFRAINKAT
jgi:hypothetical protein